MNNNDKTKIIFITLLVLLVVSFIGGFFFAKKNNDKYYNTRIQQLEKRVQEDKRIITEFERSIFEGRNRVSELTELNRKLQNSHEELRVYIANNRSYINDAIESSYVVKQVFNSIDKRNTENKTTVE